MELFLELSDLGASTSHTGRLRLTPEGSVYVSARNTGVGQRSGMSLEEVSLDLEEVSLDRPEQR
jgi:hypothetical protein